MEGIGQFDGRSARKGAVGGTPHTMKASMSLRC
jgi:hypothetical protein